mmetsp:Transcript_3025/g.9421  ORF Transcript_3025/g.9421 Transcript_3025/m.9421 type:complete len:351 (-) Transcript_3025:449-1501(-)
MGAYLSIPVTQKESEDGRNSSLRYGASSMQGWRRSMEDAHIMGAGVDGGTLFGVFDGHGGAEVARFVARHMVSEVRERWYESGEHELKGLFHRMDVLLRDPRNAEELDSLKNGTANGSGKDEDGSRVSAREALELFQQMMANSSEGGAAPAEAVPQRRRCELPDHPLQAGCTAVVVVVEERTPRRLWIANAGDSRAVACRAGRAVALSHDHKPDAPTEEARITAAGGYVECANGFFRVNGNLNLSRSIGDLKYKANTTIGPEAQIITAEPDVTIYNLSPEDEFFIVACDGIWDCVSNQEAVDFVKHRLPTAPSLSAIAEQLFDRCIAANPRETRGIGGDNMTCLIVQLST